MMFVFELHSGENKLRKMQNETTSIFIQFQLWHASLLLTACLGGKINQHIDL